jgi:hypothetical protein
MAIHTGIPHTVWLEDTRALMTAARIVEERQDGGG